MTISRAEATFIAACYSDIFNYPLYREELRFWQPFVRGEPDLKFLTQYSSRTISIRKSRERVSMKKWQLIKKIAWIYKCIPMVELVGVTGGLAMQNAAKEDDIDLFFIVSPKTLWVSRFLATILTEIIRMRRRPGDTAFSDKVCLNMFMTSDHLQLTEGERDFFSAHEVLQMKPLWEKGNAYQKFLQQNRWVEKFLPNAWEEKCQMINDKLPIKNKKFSIGHLALTILEPLARSVQLWYMQRHRTSEIATDTLIRFHPRDARVWVKEKLRRRLQSQNFPLDKIFYSR